MRYAEFKKAVRSFLGTARVRVDGGYITLTLVLFCDGYKQARALYSHLFGADNIVSIVQAVNESGQNKVQSAEELQAKAMTDQAKQLQLRVKSLKAKKSLDRAKKSLQRATVNPAAN